MLHFKKEITRPESREQQKGVACHRASTAKRAGAGPRSCTTQIAGANHKEEILRDKIA
jgi:hypothetical protein